MKEFNFVLRVLVLTFAILFFMQYEYRGKTLETRASHFFSSTQPIDWLQDTGKALSRHTKFLVKRGKEKARDYLDKN